MALEYSDGRGDSKIAASILKNNFPVRNDKYKEYLENIVLQGKALLKVLLSERDLELLDQMLKLEVESMTLLSRLCLRRHSWIKSSSLSNYLDGDEDKILHAIATLETAGLLSIVKPTSGFDDVFSAVATCCNVEEITLLHKSVSTSKQRPSGKQLLLSSIKKIVLTQKTVFGQPMSSRFGTLVAAQLRKSDRVLNVIVRVNLEVLSLVRRVQRAIQIGSVLASNWTSGAISAFHPIDYNVPLLASFNKLFFPKYQLKQSISVLFPSLRKFHIWEAVTEFRWILDNLDLLSRQQADNSKNYRLKRLLVTVIPTVDGIVRCFEGPQFIARYFQSAAGCDSMSSLLQSLLAHPRYAGMTEVDDVGEECDAFRAWVLEYLLQAAVMCFLSYIAEFDVLRSPPVLEDTFLIKFDPGHLLAYLCNDLASLYEKETHRNYPLAIMLYELLVALPYVAHRRGGWFKRLVMDYEHLKLHRCALRAVYRGLWDPAAHISDVTDLELKESSLLLRVNQYNSIEERELALSKWNLRYDLVAFQSENSSDPTDGVDLADPTVEFNVRVLLHQVNTADVRSAAAHCKLELVIAGILYFISAAAKDKGVVAGPSDEFPTKATAAPFILRTPAAAPRLTTPKSSAGPWSCQVCTYLNHDSLNYCEMCDTPKQQSAATPTASENEVICLDDDDDEISPQLAAAPRVPVTSSSFQMDDSNCLTELRRALKTYFEYYGSYLRPQSVKSLKSLENMADSQVLDATDSVGNKNGAKKRKSVDSGLKNKKLKSKSDNEEAIKALLQDSAVMAELFMELNLLQLRELVMETKQDARSGEDISEMLGLFDHLPSKSAPVSSKTQDASSSSLLSSKNRSLFALPPPKKFYVRGKRFGDPSRKGKSQFCGWHDELVSVEEFVMQKCQVMDADEDASAQELFADGASGGTEDDAMVEGGSEDNVQPVARPKTPVKNILGVDTAAYSSAEYKEVVDGGGWQGWHCEGSPLRSLFGLLFWDIIYADIDGVFMLPYQDGPLDLGYPSFFEKRKTAIWRRIYEIEEYSHEDIIRIMGERYRDHYLECCRAVAWGFPLNALQLIALCMGSKGLAAVCRGYALNYKHFSAGCADLLLLRVSVQSEFQRQFHFTTLTEDFDGGSRAVVDLGKLLGDNWRRFGAEAQVVVTDVNSLDGPKKANGDVAAVEKDGSEDAAEEAMMNEELVDLSIDAVAGDAEESRHHSRVYRGEDISASLQRIAPACDIATILSGLNLEIMFVEVKGPSDHLASKQLLWMNVLSHPSHNMKAAICCVKENVK